MPLDRARSDAGQIQIAYEFFAHSQVAAPSAGTIVPLTGGPGGSNSSSMDAWNLVFGSLRDRFDLLVIDTRGTGASGVINCQRLQHKGITRANLKACADQLGPSRDFYRSAAVADDIDDVRAALGIDKLDMYGFSWGTVEARSYASRHGDHLRSLVMDSSGQQLEVVPWRGAIAASSRRELRLECKRSVTCSAVGEDPVRRAAALASALRKHPARGLTYAPGGRRVAVRATEKALFSVTFSETLVQLPAVGRALARGDRAPLLRLIAENAFDPSRADAGPPDQFSVGSAMATLCNDQTFPWDWAAPVADRQRAWRGAFAALNPSAFAPFARDVARDNPQGIESACVFWPAPASREPPVTPQSTFPSVPALFVSGDLDGAPPEVARGLAAKFPQSTFVEPANVFHGSAFGSDCVRTIIDRFVDQLSAGDTSCAAHGMPLFGYSRFPRTARDERTSAQRRHGDQSTRRDRRAAAVALETIVDTVVHAANGHGLRGGSFKVRPPGLFLLRKCRFVKDVAVSGRASVDPATLAATVNVRVAGRGTAPGRLRMRAPAGAETAAITGTLGRRSIRLRINLPN